MDAGMALGFTATEMHSPSEVRDESILWILLWEFCPLLLREGSWLKLGDTEERVTLVQCLNEEGNPCVRARTRVSGYLCQCVHECVWGMREKVRVWTVWAHTCVSSVGVSNSNLLLSIRSLFFPGTDHHCFQGDHNFATCNNAKLKNIKAPKKSFSTIYIYLMGCYTLQLEAMNLKGNIEDLPKFVQKRLPRFHFMLLRSIRPHLVFRKYGITHS